MVKLMTMLAFLFISTRLTAGGFHPLASKHLDGCGLIASSNGAIYAETGDENLLWIRLNANDQFASLVSSKGELGKIGDSKINVYKLMNEPAIKLHMTVVGYCGEITEKNEDCELFNLNVILISGKNKQHLVAEYGC